MMHPHTVLPGTSFTLDDARARISGLHFAKEALSRIDRVVLVFAERLLAVVDAGRDDIDRCAELLAEAQRCGMGTEDYLLNNDEDQIDPDLGAICQGLAALLSGFELSDDTHTEIMISVEAVAQAASNVTLRQIADLVAQRWPGATRFAINTYDQVDEVCEVEMADGTRTRVKLDAWDRTEPLWEPLARLSFLPFEGWGLPQQWVPRSLGGTDEFWVPIDYDPWNNAHPKENR